MSGLKTSAAPAPTSGMCVGDLAHYAAVHAHLRRLPVMDSCYHVPAGLRRTAAAPHDHAAEGAVAAGAHMP